MARLRIGFIGTGKRKVQRDALGFAMAYEHADGYLRLPEHCELVACADLVRANAEAFAQNNGIPEQGIFTDYHQMLAECHLDMVSICTWPHLHAIMVIDCAVAGIRAIHCEKPMSDEWGTAKLMEEECTRRGVQLTFNHQRRFGAPFRKASDLLQSGQIGELRRIELACGNIYDWGTHYIDLCGLYNGEQAAAWVMGQIDYRQIQYIFGAQVENQALGMWQYHNGVFAIISTGAGAPMVGAAIRLLGTSGTIEIGVKDGPLLRLSSHSNSSWETVDTYYDTLHGPDYVQRAIANVVEALETGNESELNACNALHATEIIFAIYESCRRRGRVDLPLTITDNPLVSLVKTGDLRPVSSQN